MVSHRIVLESSGLVVAHASPQMPIQKEPKIITITIAIIIEIHFTYALRRYVLLPWYRIVHFLTYWEKPNSRTNTYEYCSHKPCGSYVVLPLSQYGFSIR